MTDRISDERLAELIEQHASLAATCRVNAGAADWPESENWEGAAEYHADHAAALRELQEARKIIASIRQVVTLYENDPDYSALSLSVDVSHYINADAPAEVKP